MQGVRGGSLSKMLIRGGFVQEAAGSGGGLCDPLRGLYLL
jgi:hypothetical protein